MVPRLTRLLQVACAFSVLLAASRGHAQTVPTQWQAVTNGGGTYLWNNSDNWTNGVPAGGNDAEFTAGEYSGTSPTLFSYATATSMTVDANVRNLHLEALSGYSLTLTTAFNQNSGAGSAYAVTINTALNLYNPGFTFQTNTPGAVLEVTGALTSAGTVNVTGGLELLLAGDLSGVTDFDIESAADLKFLQSGSFAMPILNNASVTFGDGSGTAPTYTGNMSGTGTVTIKDPTVFSGGTNTYSGTTYLGSSLGNQGSANSFSPSSAVVFNAGGELDLSGDETIKGLTDNNTNGSSILHINSANLTIAGSGSWYGSLLADGGTLTLNGGSSSTFTLFGTSGFGSANVVVSSGTLDFAGNSDATNSTITNNGGVLVFEQNAVQPTSNGVVNNNEVDVNAATLDAAISGTGNVYLNSVGPGNAVTVNGFQSYTGRTYIPDQVTVQDGAAGVFALNSPVVMTGASALNLGYSDNLGSLAGGSSATVSVSSGSFLTFDGDPSATGNALFEGVISGEGALDIASGSINQVLSGANTYTGGTTIEGSLIVTNQFGSATGSPSVGPGVLINSGGSLDIGGGGTGGAVAGVIDLTSGGALHYTRSDDSTFGNALTGSGDVWFQGTGATVVTATSDLTGTVHVGAGSQVVLSGGTAQLGTGNFQNSGTLAGAGSVAAGDELDLLSGSTLSPVLAGTPTTINAGSTRFTGSVTMAISMNSATGTAGTNWSLLNMSSGPVTFDSGSAVTFQLFTLSGTAFGQMSNFDPASSYQWTVIYAGDSSFGSPTFLVDSSGFQNNLGGGSFGVLQDGTDILITFSPVPEPSTWALMAVGAGLVGWSVWRARRRHCA